MKKANIIFLLLCTIGFSASAQYSMDFGVSLGGSNYIGEVGGSGTEPKPWILDMNLSKTSFGFGGFYRLNFTQNIAAKISVNYARISGADSLSGIATQRARNLSFRTDIIEAAITAEFYFLTINNLSRRSNARIDFGTYMFAGGGVALFYPYAQLNDKWYYLRPLQTEGTENAYDVMTVALPVGVGANFTFNKKLKLGIEFGYRFTFTDYLDDISTRYAAEEDLPFEESVSLANRSDQAFGRGDADLPNRNFFVAGSRRGNPETNDGYFIGQVSISYTITNRNSFTRARYNSVINRRRKRTKF